MKLPLSSLVGSLQAWYGRTPLVELDWARLEVVMQPVSGAKGWSVLSLHSERPLLRDDQKVPGPHSYHYLFRQSASHFLISGGRSEAVDVLTRRIGRHGPFAPPAVDVPRLVEDLLQRPQRYTLGGLHAKVAGQAQTLQTVALYGSDLGRAKLFKDLATHLLPYRAQLRDTHTGQIVLSIGTKGEIGFTYRGIPSLHEIDRALAFVSHSFVQWPDRKKQ
jgi:hypothetical protein